MGERGIRTAIITEYDDREFALGVEIHRPIHDIIGQGGFGGSDGFVGTAAPGINDFERGCLGKAKGCRCEIAAFHGFSNRVIADNAHRTRAVG